MLAAIINGVCSGSFATEPFSASVEQCPLCAYSDRGAAMQRMTRCAINGHSVMSALRPLYPRYSPDGLARPFSAKGLNRSRDSVLRRSDTQLHKRYCG